MKTCKNCQVMKGLESFYRKKNSLDGYGSICKECRQIEYKETYGNIQDASLKEGQIYLIPYTQKRTYAYHLAKRIALQEMTFEQLKFDLTKASQSAPLYREVLSILQLWKHPKSQ